MGLERLDKVISSSICHSRREATKIIRCGLIKVDNKTCKDPSIKCDLDRQFITFKDNPVMYKKYIYLKINKPKGILCVSNDSKVKTVVDLLPKKYSHYSLFPAGRLDKTSTGLVLLTNDGQWAHNVISPKKSIWKTYIVELDAPINNEIIYELENHPRLPDGTPCLPAKINDISDNKKIVSISIHEGKYHQIKRMFGTFNIGVNSLNRTSIGIIHLENLKSGEYRELSDDEILQFNNSRK